MIKSVFNLDLVTKKFKLPNDKQVRSSIKAKLNNTERCLKMKKE